jgi:hypothetical protein
MIMKKTSPPRTAAAEDELHQEYRFDYKKAKPNRFADQGDAARVVVVLDPDVSEVFQTPDSVNVVLRALIRSMPAKGTKPQRKARSARTTA